MVAMGCEPFFLPDHPLRLSRMSFELEEVVAVRPLDHKRSERAVRLHQQIREIGPRGPDPRGPIFRFEEFTMRFIGLDLHKKVLVVCALDERGKVLFRESVQCQRDSLVAFAKDTSP